MYEYDEVFKSVEQNILTYSTIEELRKENIAKKKDGKKIYNMIPQSGFQERVLLIDADIQIIGGKRGAGKATSNDSLIVTPHGYKRLGDLKVGDIISEPILGGRQTVIAIYEHPNHQLYEVTFDDGTKCECGDEHLWECFVYEDEEEPRRFICNFSLVREIMDTHKLNVAVRLCGIIHERSLAKKLKIDYVKSIIEQSKFDDDIIFGEYKLESYEDKQGITALMRSCGIKVMNDENERVVKFWNPNSNLNKCKLKRFVSYRDAGRKNARCISVNSDDELYMLQDYIVTHNTFIGLFKALPYINNPDVSMYGFRKLEDDVARGIWKSSKQVFRGFGTSVESGWEWHFLNGYGATMKMEHLQDPKKITDRFRGVEMAYILIEELAEHTVTDMNVLFDLLTSNRSTAGIRPRFVCTCNPVGKSNKLRHFLDWYIDPETNTIIPERDGEIRYFHRINTEDIAWGNSWEEVYHNPMVEQKIDALCDETGLRPQDFITSLVFIEGGFKDNEILQVSDPKYMSRISAKGGKSTLNDISGVWQDEETGDYLLSLDDMWKFFDNTSQVRNGEMYASADVALTGDFFVIFAVKGGHFIDVEAWRGGVESDDVIPKIEHFLRKHYIRKENFTYDANGLGMWLKTSKSFANSVPFNNKSASSDNKIWGNLKSEAADKFIKGVKRGEISIDESVLNRQFKDKKGKLFTVKDRLLQERKALKQKVDRPVFEIIPKPSMKVEVGWSPDFIEAMIMVTPLMERKVQFSRKGFDNY